MPIQVNVPGLQVPAPSDPIDLATGAFVQGVCAAGGVTLNSAQLAILPSLITAASREIIRFTGRKFGSQNYTEIVMPEGGRQDRGEPATAKLSQYPVIDVQRCATGRAAALLIANTDDTTNQDAAVQFAVSGDVEWDDLTYTGLNLTRWASGTQHTDAVTWTTTTPYTTISSVAASINALGNGWTATVQGGTSGAMAIGPMPAYWLIGAQEPKQALSPGCTLDLFQATGGQYGVQRSTGIMSFYGWYGSMGGWLWAGGGMGGPPFDSYEGQGGYGGAWSQVRIWYTAGFATIPEQLQRVCAECVKATLDRIKTDSTYKSISGGNEAEHWSKTVRDSWSSLPEWCMQTLWALKGNYI